MTYQFTLDLGDLSCDGHCRSESVLLESNTSVEDLREMYYATKLKTPEVSLDAGDWDKSRNKALCADYEDNMITKEQFEQLGLNYSDYKEAIEIEEGFYTDDFVELFIDYMTTHNPGVKLKVVDKPKYDSFNDMKPADEKRMGFMGYGLFY